MSIHESIPGGREKVQISENNACIVARMGHVAGHSELLAYFSRWGGASFEPGLPGPGDALKQERREKTGSSK
jgi:hypothetical protein